MNSPNPTYPKQLVKEYLLGLLLGLVCISLYWSTLRDLCRACWSDFGFLNGFLTLFISAFMIWRRRGDLSRLPVNGRPVIGGFLLGLACLLLVMGHVGAMVSLAGVSLIMLVWGLIETFLGGAHSRALSFPIGFIFLNIPILWGPTGWLNPPLQTITAWIAAVILHATGVGARVDGDLVTLSSTLSLKVNPGCSGVQLVVSMLAIGIALAYFLLTNLRNRGLLLSVALGTAILANGLRVAVMGICARFGVDVSGKPFHKLEGLLVSWVGYGALIAVALFLSRRECRKPSEEGVQTELESSYYFQSPWPNLRKNFIWPLAILLGTGACIWTRNEVRKPLANDFSTLPSLLRGWREIDGPPPFTPFARNVTDHDVLRRFESSLGEQVCLYIAYYESQHEGKELPDPPSSETNVVPIQSPGNQPVTACLTRVNTQSVDWQVLFWYDINGMTTPSKTEAKFLALRNKLIHNSNNAAMIVVWSSLPDRQDRDAILESQRSFIRAISPFLKQYLPS